MSYSFYFYGKPWLFPLILICFAFVHMAKMLRLYLILLDEKIPFSRFVYLYFLTTLINLIIPYKLGEFFRIYKFSKTIKSYQVGLTSVLVDRFFDTMALVFILLPFELLMTYKVTLTTLFLTIFIVILVFVYRVYPSSYTYLNRYIIMRKTSRRSMTVLKALELLKAVYDYVRKLIIGRYSLLTLLSFLAWTMECAIIYLVGQCFGVNMSDNISTYISSLISRNGTVLSRIYVLFCVVAIGVALIISLIIMMSKKDKISRV